MALHLSGSGTTMCTSKDERHAFQRGEKRDVRNKEHDGDRVVLAVRGTCKPAGPSILNIPIAR